MSQDDRLFDMPLKTPMKPTKSANKAQNTVKHTNMLPKSILPDTADEGLKSAIEMTQRVFGGVEMVRAENRQTQPTENKKVMENIAKTLTERYDDPRPDLPDHLIWDDILKIMYGKNREVCAILQAIRGLGTTLEVSKGNFKPVYPEKWGRDDTDRIRKEYLRPNIKDITFVFKRVYNKFMAIKAGLKKYEPETPF